VTWGVCHQVCRFLPVCFHNFARIGGNFSGLGDEGGVCNVVSVGLRVYGNVYAAV